MKRKIKSAIHNEVTSYRDANFIHYNAIQQTIHTINHKVTRVLKHPANNHGLTVLLQVLAAPVHHARDLLVHGVQAQLPVLLPAAGGLGGQGQLKGLQDPRLAVVQVRDAVHRHAALSGGETGPG